MPSDKLFGMEIREDPTMAPSRVEFHRPGCGCRACNPAKGPRCRCGHEMRLHTDKGLCWICACSHAKEEK